jgi:hypothetical protein
VGEGGWVHVRGFGGYGGNEGRYCELQLGQYSVQRTGRAIARLQVELTTNSTNQQKLKGKYCELQMGRYSVQGAGQAIA